MTRKQQANRPGAARTWREPGPRADATLAPAVDPATGRALQEAARLLQLGDLARAGAACRRILERQPDQPDALHLLGIALLRQGQGATAEDLLRRAVAARPNFPEAVNNLGNILKDKGELDEAARCYRQTLQMNPRHAMAHFNLANVLRDQDRTDDAIEGYRRALALDPNYAAAHNNLGSVLQELGRNEEAIESYQRVLAINPEHANAHNNLGKTLLACERRDEAELHLRAATKYEPRHVEAHNNLGLVLSETGRLDEAVDVFRHGLAIDPKRAELHSNLGVTLRIMRRLDDALASCRRAVEIDPDSATVHCSLGMVLQNLWDFDAAEAAYRRASELDPESATAHYLLGGLHKSQGRLHESEAELRRALELQPDQADAHSALLFFMNYRRRNPGSLYQAHRAWGSQHAAPLHGDSPAWENEADPERRLRVGYVSADFRGHSVNFFFEPLLEAHDRRAVEVFCYADVLSPDAVTDRLRDRADHWFSCVGVSDASLARQIRADRVDILVDLAGHTGGNRLLAFARKPAPIQVTWLGYPNTTGMEAMDYRLTDARADPEGESDGLHCERLVRLPDGFLCYRPPEDAPEATPPPCLESGGVIFGSFNNLAKISPESLKAWARILKAVPGSRLLLKSKPLANDSTRNRYMDMFRAEGIEAERLTLTGWMPTTSGHLSLYGKVDIGLDTFPYNGTATTCEALWMGVPVVSLAGTQHAGRVGLSLLNTAGLNDLVAESAGDYIEIAAALARDPERLASLRAGLRGQLLSSALCQPERFAGNIEAAYRAMWREWCASQTVGSPLLER